VKSFAAVERGGKERAIEGRHSGRVTPSVHGLKLVVISSSRLYSSGSSYPTTPQLGSTPSYMMGLRSQSFIKRDEQLLMLSSVGRIDCIVLFRGISTSYVCLAQL
jgi:hypothetical protein